MATEKMKVLVIGAGGREHAIAWALAKSPRVDEVVCAPGNAGIAKVARCVHVDVADLHALMALVSREQPGLVVIGPELPLSLGLTDELLRRGVRVFGPTKAAATLETSKSFAKRFLQRHNLPTAAYAVISEESEAEDVLTHFRFPVVVKADGLAAGKGVVIAKTKEEAHAAIAGLFSGQLLGTRERSVLIEEFLDGEELSFLVISDGTHASPLAPAQDHKRIGEGDTGPNTGGMGVYSTDAMLSPELRDWIMHHIVQPTLDGMRAEDAPFVGVLYCGLMMTARGPMVLEFNARFGDPETQAILVRLESDLLDAMEAAVEGRLSETELRWKPGASACVIASSAGYPGHYPKGLPITGLERAALIHDVEVFHSGTGEKGGHLVTAGGRVLGATAVAPDLEWALAKAYEALGMIHFDGIYYRHDIGYRAVKETK
jgi:phosphoribosylamine--glycine ligase